MTDWSDGEKAKIWKSACNEEGVYQELTFEQFKALIIGDGGFHLKEKVEGMAATAQAEQMENGNEPVGQELVGLTHGIPSSVSLPRVAIGQKSSDSLMAPPYSSDLDGAAGGCGTPPGQVLRDVSRNSLPVLQEKALTSPSGFDVDPNDSQRGVRKLGRSQTSSSGQIGRGAWYGHGDFSDSDDERDEDGKLQPKLLTKRRTNNNGGASPDLVRSASEGGALRSPRAQAPPRRTPYGLTSNGPPLTPNELPNRSRPSPTAAGGRSPSSHANAVTFKDGHCSGASPDPVAEHGITCPAGQELSADSSRHSGTGASPAAALVRFQRSLACVCAMQAFILASKFCTKPLPPKMQFMIERSCNLKLSC